jgi:hypothetical protein
MLMVNTSKITRGQNLRIRVKSVQYTESIQKQARNCGVG